MLKQRHHLEQKRGRKQADFRTNGFTVIEVIGVLSIIAILAAAMIPAMMRSMRRTERQNEELNLETIANGLKDYMLRERIIPDENDWAQAVADEIEMPLNRVLLNDGGWTRVLLVDPDLRVGVTNTSVLPYSQTIQGSIFPVSPRAVILSSLTRSLPTLATNEFDAVWDADPGTIPHTWSSDWQQHADDVKVQRLDFRDSFHRLVLNNIDTQIDAWFSIDDHAAVTLPATNLVERWYLKNSTVGLRFSDGTIQLQEILQSDQSYVFQNGSWSRKFSQGASGTGAFGQLVETFLNAPLAPSTAFGANQQAVINEMYWYMWAYALWAMDGFPKGGSNSDQQVPNFRAVTDSQDRLDDFTENLIQ
jgi:type II secretory pathway pseudopilin PulG